MNAVALVAISIDPHNKDEPEADTPPAASQGANTR